MIIKNPLIIKKAKLQAKIATPTTSSQTIVADSNYDGLSSVEISAVDNTIDSNITAGNIKKDVTILGVTGTLESGGGLPEYMSAKNFTFDGNACTGYVGDTSVPQIIIPKSYSLFETQEQLLGSYVNRDAIFHETNSNISNITLCNEDGTNVHSYSSTSALNNEGPRDFASVDKILIKQLIYSYNFVTQSAVKTYIKNILAVPIYYKNIVYNNTDDFLNAYFKTKNLTEFGGIVAVKHFKDGEDVQVTSINGKDNKSGFSSYTGDIIVPASITNFGDRAFYNCSNNRILIDKMTSIGQDAFYNCSGIDKLSLNYASSISEFAFYKTNIDNLYVPSNISTISRYAFTYCPLKSLVFENGISTIEDGAFENCTTLTPIAIPESLVNVTGSAFGNCNLDSISVDINNSTFYVQDNCLINRNTKELTIGTNSSIIPNDVTSIGNSAFNGRSRLTSVIIPDTATSIGNLAFYNCSGLTSITIPNSVTSIGDQAFIRCENLKTISIPENLQKIQYYTFGYCTGLTSITIPASVTSIATYVFNECSALTEMTILATTPPTLAGTNAISSATTTIYIPAGTLEAYQTATNWSSFASKFVELSA